MARIHIIKRGTGWAVKAEGAKRAKALFPNKDSALKSAQSLRKSGNDIVVHKADGTVQKWEKAKVK
ncbi:MAG: DUF2188 domain-containing protein [Cyclobacteriaceae bacterium]